MEQITLRANAKINLALAVMGKREDGYHLIDTVMQSVGLYDTVTIKKSDSISVECGLSIPQEENIAYKAANLFFKETELLSGAEISIKKKIPSAAGLGGGSADAAAVLIGLNKLFSAKLNNQQLSTMALALGADVPFFIEGGTQRAQGIGERLTPIKNLTNCSFVIVKEGTKPSTKEMYTTLDSKEYLNPDIEKLVKAIESEDINLLCASLGNCFSVIYRNEEIISLLKQTKPLGICLSGSGPSLFAVFKKNEEANKAVSYLKEKGITAFCAQAKAFGVETE